MKPIDINEFSTEKECSFDGERYSVRDNGAVLRYPQPNKRPRPTDNKWTFGKTNTSNAYLHISDARIHRIVATAFHGEPPDPKYVVDHIDSNCRNNRPENLRWLTRLENVLLNPATRKKVEYLCGSIEAFLENPSMLNKMNLEPNISWMRSVTKEEAQNCKVRMAIWVKTTGSSANSPTNGRNTFNARVLKPIHKWEAGLGREPGLDLALTPMCAQYMWTAGMYFPCCPEETGSNPIQDYYQSLQVGKVFSRSDNSDFCPESEVVEFIKSNDDSSILVLSITKESGTYLISGIQVNEKGFFIHFNLGSYEGKEAALSEFIRKQELSDYWSEAYRSLR